MVGLKNLVNTLYRRKTGLSKDPSSSASKYPSPCLYRGERLYHTSNNITWSVFKERAKEIGYEPTCQNFIKMSEDVFGRIFKATVWDEFALDNVNDQAIASTVAWWAFKSGVGATFEFMKQFLKKKGIFVKKPSDIAKYLNVLSKTDSKEMFSEMSHLRIDDYKAFNEPAKAKALEEEYKDFTDYIDGYADKIDKYGSDTIVKSFINNPVCFVKRNKVMTAITVIGLIGAGYLYVNLFKKK